jgi:hypothetical protein
LIFNLIQRIAATRLHVLRRMRGLALPAAAAFDRTFGAVSPVAEGARERSRFKRPTQYAAAGHCARPVHLVAAVRRAAVAARRRMDYFFLASAKG